MPQPLNLLCGGSGTLLIRRQMHTLLPTDDGPRPRLYGVEGYHHANLALVHDMGRGQLAMVDWSIPVVAKRDECVV
jgi:hypothetical protein